MYLTRGQFKHLNDRQRSKEFENIWKIETHEHLSYLLKGVKHGLQNLGSENIETLKKKVKTNYLGGAMLLKLININYDHLV